jgi:hypothetical protein
LKRPALTLIEVVAAVTLLATVAASVLVAQSRSMRMIHRADARRKAAEFAESLVTQWRLEKTPLDTPDQGNLGEHKWIWKRQVEREHISLGQEFGAQQPEVLRIRLTVLDDESRLNQPVQLAAVEWLEPVVRKTR